MMAKLTDDQKEFLTNFGISTTSIFDASGLSPSEYRERMKSLDLDFAIGVTPCKKHGHTLRSRSGHCVQCNPSLISFRRRHSKTAYVYVAGSQTGKIIKIGSCSDPLERQATLVEQGYGGVCDWKLLHYVRSPRAGELETDVQRNLNRFSHRTTYMRSGSIQKCRETYRCNVALAIKEIEICKYGIDVKRFDEVWTAPDVEDYEF